MVFNAIFNNISVIWERSGLLVEETGENHWPVTNMEKADVCPQKNTFTCNYKHDSFTLPYFCVSNQDLDIHRKMLWHFCVQWFEWQWIMVFNATFNNISVLLVEETQRKPPTCCTSLTNFITYVVSSTPHLSGIRTHNVSSLIWVEIGCWYCWCWWNYCLSLFNKNVDIE